MRTLLGILALFVATALGFLGRGLLEGPAQLSIPFADKPYKPSMMNLGCDVVVEGTAYESRFEGTANVRAMQTNEKIAIKISPDKKTLSVLSADQVAMGSIEPSELNIFSYTSYYVVASAPQTLGQTTVILDMRTFKAVLNYTGQGMLGIKGGSYLMQCH